MLAAEQSRTDAAAERREVLLRLAAEAARVSTRPSATKKRRIGANSARSFSRRV